MSASSEWMAAVAATLNAQPSRPQTDEPESQASVAVSESESASSPEQSHSDEVSSASAAVDEQLDGPAVSPVNDMADIFGSAPPPTPHPATGSAAPGVSPAEQSTVETAGPQSALPQAPIPPLSDPPPSASVSLLDVFAGGDLDGENPGPTLASEAIFDPFAEPAPTTVEMAVTAPQGTDALPLRPQDSSEVSHPQTSADVFDPFADDEAGSPADTSVGTAPEQLHHPATSHDDTVPTKDVASAPEEAAGSVDDWDSQAVQDDDLSATSIDPEPCVSSTPEEEPAERRPSPAPATVEAPSLHESSSGAAGDTVGTVAPYTPRRARPVAVDGPAGTLSTSTPGDTAALAADDAERLSVLAAHLGLSDAETMSLAIRALAVAHRLHD